MVVHGRRHCWHAVLAAYMKHLHSRVCPAPGPSICCTTSWVLLPVLLLQDGVTLVLQAVAANGSMMAEYNVTLGATLTYIDLTQQPAFQDTYKLTLAAYPGTPWCTGSTTTTGPAGTVVIDSIDIITGPPRNCTGMWADDADCRTDCDVVGGRCLQTVRPCGNYSRRGNFSIVHPAGNGGAACEAADHATRELACNQVPCVCLTTPPWPEVVSWDTSYPLPEGYNHTGVCGNGTTGSTVAHCHISGWVADNTTKCKPGEETDAPVVVVLIGTCSGVAVTVAPARSAGLSLYVSAAAVVHVLSCCTSCSCTFVQTVSPDLWLRTMAPGPVPPSSLTAAAAMEAACLATMAVCLQYVTWAVTQASTTHAHQTVSVILTVAAVATARV